MDVIKKSTKRVEFYFSLALLSTLIFRIMEQLSQTERKLKHLKAATRTPKRIIIFFKKKKRRMSLLKKWEVFFFIVKVEDQNKYSIYFSITSLFKGKF
jgi:hypothetical protein